MTRTSFLCLLAAAALPCHGAITLTAPADKTYNAGTSTTITVNADSAAGSTTTATLDGQPFPIGVATLVTKGGYHELLAESRNAGGTVLDSQLRRFIITTSGRGSSENGIPPHTPYKTVNDAPSAFAGGTLKIIAPAAWPVGFPAPIAAKLLNASNETLRLSGVVTFGGMPGTSLQLRRGWGSVVAPAATAPRVVAVGARVNGRTHNPSIDFQAMTFTDVSGTISSNTTWPANSRMRITSTLTVNAGATLTIGEGTIVLLSTGTATNGTGAEISVSGTLQCNGTETNPIVFAPATVGLNWGGIEMPAATSVVNANWTIFTGAGEDENWTNNSTLDGPSHQAEQPVFAIAGSGSGTAIGAQLHLNDCFSFSHAGQQMNSRTNTWIDLQRTLYQRCITSGELNGSKVTIDRSALIEFPGETGNFVDDDNDALYMTNGDLSITNTIIGFTKDDGVDTGGDGGNSPFGTINPATGNTITRYVSTNNWYEGTYHEGNSLSGTRYVYFTGCVFYNCGQGIEAGYSASGGDGPNAFVDGCLFASNMVALRWGDNYQFSTYNGSMEAKNSIVLHSLFHDLFSYNWQTNLSSSWTYQTTNVNMSGHPYFNAFNNYVSQHEPARHPSNIPWNPANPAHAAAIAPFMPVPGSNVGVGITSYDPAQNPTSSFPGVFTARLSTFSSNPVSVDWVVVGKSTASAPLETSLASGTLNFAPGETLKTFTAAVASPGNYGVINVKLINPVNAEVTGDALYVAFPPAPPVQNFFVYGSGGTGSNGSGTPGSTWKYKTDFTTATLPAFITSSGTTWMNPGFNDSGWASGATQLGYGDNDENNAITQTDYDSATTGTQRAPSYLFRSTFNIADVTQLGGIAGEVKCDDGVVVYVNGTEVLRTANISPTATLSSYANYNGAAATENATSAITVPLNLVHDGTNTIAVELHQQANDSSDISFDLRLAGSPPSTSSFTLNSSTSDESMVLWWFTPTDYLEHSYDLINWQPAPYPGSPASIVPTAPQEFFRLRRP